MLESNSTRIEDAFRAVRRDDFLPKECKKHANIDEPLYIGFGQTNSQPSTVAFMLNLLNVQLGDKVLDVGSGSGWTTALLAYLTGGIGRVVGIEAVLELVKFGQKNLKKYDFPWARIESALEGSLGFPAEAPYDKILVSASARELPQELVDQLKIGGRMVIPVGDSVFSVDKMEDGRSKIKEYPGFVFVPLQQSDS